MLPGENDLGLEGWRDVEQVFDERVDVVDGPVARKRGKNVRKLLFKACGDTHNTSKVKILKIFATLL
jgi:hypothetical protein